MMPTLEQIREAMTPDGGWTRAQLEEWGVPWPPPKGWRRALEIEAQERAEKEPKEAIPLGKALLPTIKRLAAAYGIAQSCESPIEIVLGAALMLRASEVPHLEFVAQYPWRRYRIDWAALRKGDKTPVMFIECDGKDFHTSEEQLARDKTRDEECTSAGIRVVRFTGQEINRSADFCAHVVFGHLRELACP